MATDDTSSRLSGPFPALHEGSISPRYRVGDIEVRPAEGTVRRAGEDVYLRPKTFQVLLYLLRHHDRVVTKDELHAELWKDTAVTDDALVQCIVEARKALGDDPRSPHYIRTLPKAGYRFIGPVESLPPVPAGVLGSDETPVVHEVSQAPRTPPPDGVGSSSPAASRLARGRWRGKAVIGATLVLALVAGVLWTRFRPEDPTVSPAAASGQVSVAVIPFAQRSVGDDLGWWREGLADMLITSLSRSPHLRLVSRQRVVELLRRRGIGDAGAITVDAARAIARQAQAGAVVVGSFAQAGTRIRIDAQVLDVVNGTVLGGESAVLDSADAVLTEVDVLAVRLTTHFREKPGGPTSGTSLADAMTSNLDAYRYYSLALQRTLNFRNREAIALLEKATALDPGFAMAHARIGFAYAVSWGLLDEGKPYLDKAFALAARLTEKDRLSIAAWRAVADRDFEGAIRLLQQLIVKYPTEMEAYSHLGRLLTGEARYDEALRLFQQALALDPDSPDLYNRLGGLYVEMNRPLEAQSAAERYLALAPNEPNAHDTLGLCYQWRGLYQQAAGEFSRALAIDPEFEVSVVHLGNVYFQTGRYRAAVRQFERYITLARSVVEKRRGYVSLFWIYRRIGDRRGVEDQIRRSEQLGSGAMFEELLWALETGRPARAEELKAQVFGPQPWGNRGRRDARRVDEHMRGLLALSEGRTEEAIAHFKASLAAPPAPWGLFAHEDCLANAFLQIGRLDDAIAEYRRVLAANPAFPLASYCLAQAYERKGLSGEARVEYERFLQTWRDADADLPEVVDARRRLAKLK